MATSMDSKIDLDGPPPSSVPTDGCNSESTTATSNNQANPHQFPLPLNPDAKITLLKRPQTSKPINRQSLSSTTSTSASQGPSSTSQPSTTPTILLRPDGDIPGSPATSKSDVHMAAAGVASLTIASSIKHSSSAPASLSAFDTASESTAASGALNPLNPSPPSAADPSDSTKPRSIVSLEYGGEVPERQNVEQVYDGWILKAMGYIDPTPSEPASETTTLHLREENPEFLLALDNRFERFLRGMSKDAGTALIREIAAKNIVEDEPESLRLDGSNPDRSQLVQSLAKAWQFSVKVCSESENGEGGEDAEGEMVRDVLIISRNDLSAKPLVRLAEFSATLSRRQQTVPRSESPPSAGPKAKQNCKVEAPFKIMTRPGGPASKVNRPSSCPATVDGLPIEGSSADREPGNGRSQLSFEERERKYQEARSRIFAEQSAPSQQAAGSTPALQPHGTGLGRRDGRNKGGFRKQFSGVDEGGNDVSGIRGSKGPSGGRGRIGGDRDKARTDPMWTSEMVHNPYGGYYAEYASQPPQAAYGPYAPYLISYEETAGTHPHSQLRPTAPAFDPPMGPGMGAGSWVYPPYPTGPSNYPPYTQGGEQMPPWVHSPVSMDQNDYSEGLGTNFDGQSFPYLQGQPYPPGQANSGLHGPYGQTYGQGHGGQPAIYPTPSSSYPSGHVQQQPLQQPVQPPQTFNTPIGPPRHPPIQVTGPPPSLNSYAQPYAPISSQTHPQPWSPTAAPLASPALSSVTMSSSSLSFPMNHSLPAPTPSRFGRPYPRSASSISSTSSNCSSRTASSTNLRTTYGSVGGVPPGQGLPELAPMRHLPHHHRHSNRATSASSTASNSGSGSGSALTGFDQADSRTSRSTSGSSASSSERAAPSSSSQCDPSEAQADSASTDCGQSTAGGDDGDADKDKLHPSLPKKPEWIKPPKSRVARPSSRSTGSVSSRTSVTPAGSVDGRSEHEGVAPPWPNTAVPSHYASPTLTPSHPKMNLPPVGFTPNAATYTAPPPVPPPPGQHQPAPNQWQYPQWNGDPNYYGFARQYPQPVNNGSYYPLNSYGSPSPVVHQGGLEPDIRRPVPKTTTLFDPENAASKSGSRE